MGWGVFACRGQDDGRYKPEFDGRWMMGLSVAVLVALVVAYVASTVL